MLFLKKHLTYIIIYSLAVLNIKHIYASDRYLFTDFIITPDPEELFDPFWQNIELHLDPDKYSAISLNPDYNDAEHITAEIDGVTYDVHVEFLKDGLSVRLLLDDISTFQHKDAEDTHDGETAGTLKINVPANYFRIDYVTQNVEEIPYSDEQLAEMNIPGAWHISGTEWKHQGLFSVHDDDLMDRYVKSSGYSSWMKAGYQSLLYPMLESLGIRACLAVEGQRCGMTATPPSINFNGRTALRLQNEKKWELMAHSMTARYDYANYYVESLDSDLARQILKMGVYKGLNNNNTTSVYDAETHKQYSVNEDLSGWIETPREYIKCYIRDYATKKLKMYNPAFPIDYQWGEMAQLAPEFQFDIKAWVTPAETSCHINVPLINEVFPYGFANFGHESCNVPPLRSAVTRLPVEGLWLSGYKGEQDSDNTFNQTHFDYFKSKIDEAADKGGWIILALHAYRPCWVNKLPGALVSEGGTYPDEWVIPLRDMQQYPDTYPDPPVEKGITRWADWYPCPGTRLDMLWQLLKYAKEKGLLNVTSSEGFAIIGNKRNIGFYDGGSFLVNNMNKIEGSDGNYPHYIIGANDEVSYYNPAYSSRLNIEYTFDHETIITDNNGISTLRNVYSIDGVKYNSTTFQALPKGVWIINGRKYIKK